jgi:phage gp16-like protein
MNGREDLLTRGEEIMQEWRNQGTNLDLSKKKAQLEQLGFIARLSDDTYLNNLKREGRKSRLSNKLKFQEELQKSIFDDERELFENDISFRQALKKDSSEFSEMLNQQGLDWKQALAVAEMKSKANEQIWTGAGQIAQTGYQGYSQMQADERAGRQKWVDAGSPGTYESWSEANEKALYGDT